MRTHLPVFQRFQLSNTFHLHGPFDQGQCHGPKFIGGETGRERLSEKPAGFDRHPLISRSMGLCVQSCALLCACMCVCVHAHVLLCAYTHVSKCVFTRVHTSVFPCPSVLACEFLCLCVPMCMAVYLTPTCAYGVSMCVFVLHRNP